MKRIVLIAALLFAVLSVEAQETRTERDSRSRKVERVSDEQRGTFSRDNRATRKSDTRETEHTRNSRNDSREETRRSVRVEGIQDIQTSANNDRRVTPNSGTQRVQTGRTIEQGTVPVHSGTVRTDGVRDTRTDADANTRSQAVINRGEHTRTQRDITNIGDRTQGSSRETIRGDRSVYSSGVRDSRNVSDYNNTRAISRSQVHFTNSNRPPRTLSHIPMNRNTVSYGNDYYFYNDRFYYYDSGMYYESVPYYGFYMPSLPYGARPLPDMYGYYWHNGVYFMNTFDGFEVVPPPVGTIVRRLPVGYQLIRMNGRLYYEYANVIYERVRINRRRVFRVVGVLW